MKHAQKMCGAEICKTSETRVFEPMLPIVGHWIDLLFLMSKVVHKDAWNKVPPLISRLVSNTNGNGPKLLWICKKALIDKASAENQSVSRKINQMMVHDAMQALNVGVDAGWDLSEIGYAIKAGKFSNF
jgi:hypothetical protein